VIHVACPKCKKAKWRRIRLSDVGTLRPCLTCRRKLGIEPRKVRARRVDLHSVELTLFQKVAQPPSNERGKRKHGNQKHRLAVGRPR
jgi:hypothetical protein